MIEINAPPSKSYTNRALIIATLAQGKSILKNSSHCEDSRYLIKALKEFGVKIRKRSDGSLVVHGTNGKIKTPKKEIFIDNSGTAMRFLTTFATLCKGEVVLRGNKRMNERPIQDLIDALQKVGVKVYSKNRDGCPPVVVQGGNLPGGKVKLKGKRSSQYLSSLLMSAPYAKKNMEIEIIGKLTSKPYVDLTLTMMKKFGVGVTNKKYKKFIIKSNQKYKGKEVRIEGDASNASYFFALAAITKRKIKVKGLGYKSTQGDVHFVDVLEKMGCHVNFGKDWIEVEGGNLNGISIDMDEMPDVVQTLAVTALFAKGKTKIFNVPNLRIKETDRIKALVRELRKVGAEVKELPDGLIIEPPKKLEKKAEIETYDDHRMAMSFGILSLIKPKIRIGNPGCVKKSWPGFWEVLGEVKNEWQ